MPSPFEINSAAISRDRKHKKFLDNEDNEVDEEGNTLRVKLHKKTLNMLITMLPHIKHHYEQYFNPNDESDIELMADIDELYEELMELKTVFLKEKENKNI